VKKLHYLCRTVQKIAAAILLLAFFGQTFNQGLFFIDYMVDKAAYEKKCINKARPKLQCHGKCQLMKKIEEKEKRERGEAPEMKLANKVEVLSSKSSFLLNAPLATSFNTQTYLLLNTGTPIDQPSSFFHPPNC